MHELDLVNGLRDAIFYSVYINVVYLRQVSFLYCARGAKILSFGVMFQERKVGDCNILRIYNSNASDLRCHHCQV